MDRSFDIWYLIRHNGVHLFRSFSGNEFTDDDSVIIADIIEVSFQPEEIKFSFVACILLYVLHEVDTNFQIADCVSQQYCECSMF